jgi:protocatechuate 3,4-dioxygenase beta subunit
MLSRGQVLDLETRKPIAKVVLDFWQASANGNYDFQDPENQTDNNLRGTFCKMRRASTGSTASSQHRILCPSTDQPVFS